MAQKTWIKADGEWKDVSMIWRKVGGEWKNYVISWYKTGGVWKQVMVYPVPATPASLNLTQPTSGEHIHAGWSSSAGATGYRLLRKPYYNGSSWVDSWSEKYTGPNTSYDDDIQTEGPMTDGDPVTYKVSAYNGSGESSFTTEQTINWADI